MSIVVDYPTHIPPIKITASCCVDAADELIISAFSQHSCSVRIRTFGATETSSVSLSRSDAIDMAHAILAGFNVVAR